MILELKIKSQDFKKAGEASFEIKNRLKRLGLRPDIIRRVATAVYEAELNVYAQKGTIRVCIEDHCIMEWAFTGGESKALGREARLTVDGIHHVAHILGLAENGILREVPFSEAWGCPGGCLGGPSNV